MKIYLNREKLQQKIDVLRYLKKDLESDVKENKTLNKDLKTLTETRSLITLASKTTQGKLENNLSGIVTLALKTVFGNRYSFKVKFVQRRNTTECDLLLVENGRETHPIYSDGFGVCDIISLASRISYWKLQGDSRNVMLLDEPFRFLQGKKLHDLAATMIKEISKKLNLQFIIVTNEGFLIKQADKKFVVERIGGISKVTEDNND